MVSEMNPMELMDSPATAVDDDVFVNLDAFDMLGDFPELEILDHSGNNSGSWKEIKNDPFPAEFQPDRSASVPQGQSNQSETAKDVKDESSSSATNIRDEFREGSASITDYSPEWAYPEGGVKVLVTGPWYSSSSRYTVLFDSFPVPTSLVQSGVLRCFCPGKFRIYPPPFRVDVNRNLCPKPTKSVWPRCKSRVKGSSSQTLSCSSTRGHRRTIPSSSKNRNWRRMKIYSSSLFSRDWKRSMVGSRSSRNPEAAIWLVACWESARPSGYIYKFLRITV